MAETDDLSTKARQVAAELQQADDVAMSLLEWHDEDQDIEVEVLDDGVYVYFYDKRTGQEWTKPLGDLIAHIEELQAEVERRTLHGRFGCWVCGKQRLPHFVTVGDCCRDKWRAAEAKLQAAERKLDRYREGVRAVVNGLTTPELFIQEAAAHDKEQAHD